MSSTSSRSNNTQKETKIVENRNHPRPWEVDDDVQEDDGFVEIDTSNVNYAYLPLERQKPMSTFYLNNIKLTVATRKDGGHHEECVGRYSGTVSGHDTNANGLGEWSFVDKESSSKSIEVKYRGEWQNGQWNGSGDFSECFQTSDSIIRVDVARAHFDCGKLIVTSEDSSNAHISVVRTLSNGKEIELHYYGQMKEFDKDNVKVGSICPLKFLKNALYSCKYYFPSMQTRESFKRVAQIHVISSQMGDKKGYQIYGFWSLKDNRNVIKNVFKNDFNEKKLELIDAIKELIKQTVLNCSNESRYLILGFYTRLLKRKSRLKDFIEAIIKETDSHLVSTQLKERALSFKDHMMLEGEISDFLDLESYDDKIEEIKEMMIKFTKEKYVPWLASKDKYDKLPDEWSWDVYLFDASVLQMIAEIRDEISNYWDISPSFDLGSLVDGTNGEKLVELFRKSWRTYFTDKSKLKAMIGIISDDGFYSNSNGYNEFVERAQELSRASRSLAVWFKSSIEILIRIDNARKVGNQALQMSLSKFYDMYCDELFMYKMHLDGNRIVDYDAKMTGVQIKLIDWLIKEFHMFDIKRFLTSLKTREVINTNFLLSITIFLTNAKNEISKCDNQLIKDLIQAELNFIAKVQEQTELNFDDMITLFNDFLSAFVRNLTRWKVYSKSTKIADTVKRISEQILVSVKLILLDGVTNKELFALVRNSLEKLNSVLINIEYLPLYGETNPLARKREEIAAEELDDYLERNKTIGHCSYELIDESLTILSSLLDENHKNSSNMDKIRISESFCDVLNELTKKFDQQSTYKDLNNFKSDKMKHFRHCKEITSSSELLDYLAALKTLISIKSNQIQISSRQAIDEYRSWNNSVAGNMSEFEELYKKYEKYLNHYRREFIVDGKSLSSIVEELRKIAKNDGSDEKAVKKRILKILAGLSWILTAKATKMVDREGKWMKSSGDDEERELSPHVIQILGCMRMLALDRDLGTNKVSDWLSHVPKQVAEVLTGQGKSWQLALIAMTYALFNYEVVIACYSDYLSRRDEREIRNNFCYFNRELKNVSFKTLEKLVASRIEGSRFKKGESISDLYEQIVHKGEYTKYDNTSSENGDEPDKTKTILLIDEVDTVISSELDNFINRVKLIEDKDLATGIEEMYKCAKKFAQATHNDDTETKREAFEKFDEAIGRSEIMRRVADNYSKLFKQLKDHLWYYAWSVAYFYSNNAEKQKRGKEELKKANMLNACDEPLTRLSSDCAHWEYYSRREQKWVTNMYLLWNVFFYLELFSKQSRYSEKNYKAYGFIMISGGVIYYDSVVSDAAKNLMIGVTGSLIRRSNRESLLSSAEMDILGDKLLKVSPQQITYFPSFFGKVHVDSKQFSIYENDEEWRKEIIKECEKLSKEDKAVLVFFREESDLEHVFNKLVAKDPYVLTNNSISINKDGNRKAKSSELYTRNEIGDDWVETVEKLISEHHAGKPGKITLAVSSFARGTDFKCSEAANKHGGLHVVQTWFSLDPKEQVQVRGRTGRNGAPGVYIQMLSLDYLKKHTFYEPSKSDVDSLSKSTTYDELCALAQKYMNKKYADLEKRLDQHKEKSEATLNWLNSAREDRRKKLRLGEPRNIDHGIRNYSSLCIF